HPVSSSNKTEKLSTNQTIRFAFIFFPPCSIKLQKSIAVLKKKGENSPVSYKKDGKTQQGLPSHFFHAVVLLLNCKDGMNQI
ncbi:hypothetical protein, partial [Acinetobacter baumannii]|uniref:hypothetical protein n=1 Tax=Acinetobacter baumannii TaxID=470 RepID=UPI0031F41CD1